MRTLLLFLCIGLTAQGRYVPNIGKLDKPNNVIEVVTGLSTNIFSFAKDKHYLYFDNVNGISRIDVHQNPSTPVTIVSEAKSPLAFAFLNEDLYFTSYTEKNTLFRLQKNKNKEHISKIISGKFIPYGIAAEKQNIYIGLEDESAKKSKIVKLDFENTEEPKIQTVINNLNYPTNITKRGNNIFFTEANKIYKVDLKNSAKAPVLLYTAPNLPTSEDWSIKSIAIHKNNLYYSNNEKGTICRINWKKPNDKHQIILKDLSLPTALSVINNELYIALHDKIVKTNLLRFS